MIKKTKNDISFYEFELLQEFKNQLHHAVFTRSLAISDLTSIQNILETTARPISFYKQLHGTKGIIVSAEKEKLPLTGDILITDQSQTPLLIRIADCASIFFFDPVRRVIANIHAGWRGLAQKIIHHVVEKLKQTFQCRSKNLCACISPMLGPCCSRFTDPQNELPKFLHPFIAKENHVNLWNIVEAHLQEIGIPQRNIENARMCTSCHLEDFYSYRREGDKGRFGTAIMLL